MRMGRLPALINSAALLGAALAITEAAAQTAPPTPAAQYMQVVNEARATFSVLPLNGPIELGFGAVRHGKRFHAHELTTLSSFQDVSFHRGVDYRAAEGAPIVAPGSGRVSRIELNSGDNGNWLEIDHGQGLRTRYTHLSAIDVSVGDNVVAGQEIARVGHTGVVRDSAHPHLHFEVLTMRLHPGAAYFIDPELVLPAHAEH